MLLANARKQGAEVTGRGAISPSTPRVEPVPAPPLTRSCLVPSPAPSLPKLQDLRACLENTSLLGHLAQSFAGATMKRLLHPGRELRGRAASGDGLGPHPRFNTREGSARQGSHVPLRLAVQSPRCTPEDRRPTLAPFPRRCHVRHRAAVHFLHSSHAPRRPDRSAQRAGRFRWGGARGAASSAAQVPIEARCLSSKALLSLPTKLVLYPSFSSDTALAPARAATQNYLRTRRDAIRCIVGLLTADEESEDNVVLEELEDEGEGDAAEVHGGAVGGWGFRGQGMPMF